MNTERDPRDRITEQAFRVEPELLGIPLASPWRRLVAFCVDGVIAKVIVTLLGAIILLWLSFVCLKSAWWSSQDRPVWGIRRWGLTGLGLVLLVLGGSELTDDSWTEIEVKVGSPSDGTDLGKSPAIKQELTTGQVGSLMLARLSADSEQEADAAVARIIRDVQTASSSRERPHELSLEQMGKLLEVALSNASDNEHIKQALRRAAKDMALSTATASSSPALALSPSRGDRDCLSNEAADNHTLAEFGSILEILGLTIGWMGLYFVLSTTYLRGQTFGKRLLGIRVVRLDGHPLGLWSSFERFSGYSAGVATGFLGFLQIYWDRNRQGVHDKISSTAVIRGDIPSRQTPSNDGDHNPATAKLT